MNALRRVMAVPRALVRRILAGGVQEPPEWVGSGQISAAGSEIRYWREKGLGLGTGIYNRYLKAFRLDRSNLAERSVADFGCGPFGGIMAVVEVGEAFPIDVLAGQYNEWERAAHRIYAFDGDRTEIAEGACDIVFSTNALDHTPDPQPSIDEINRILRPGGRFFLHVHLRHPHELNKAHPVSWSKAFAHEKLSGFEILWEEEYPEDRINEKPYRTLLMELRKPQAA